MNLEAQIELLDGLIKEDSDSTIKDFLEAKKEIERIEQSFLNVPAKINSVLKESKQNVKAA